MVYSVSDIHHFLHSLCRWLFIQFSKVAPQTSLDIAFGPCLKCLGTTAVFPRGLTISNEEVRRRSDQPPLTHIICTSRVKFFGYIAHAQSNPHNQETASAIWSTMSESDLAPLNIGQATACHRTQNRRAWGVLVGTATSASGRAT